VRLTAVPTIVMLHVELRSIVSAIVRVLRCFLDTLDINALD